MLKIHKLSVHVRIILVLGMLMSPEIGRNRRVVFKSKNYYFILFSTIVFFSKLQTKYNLMMNNDLKNFGKQDLTTRKL